MNAVMGRLSQIFLGEAIRDWGVVFEEDRGMISERLQIGLYEKNRQLNLLLTVRFRTLGVPSLYAFQIPVAVLGSFVSTLQRRYDALYALTNRPEVTTPTASDRLPLPARVLLNLIHGIRASRLLLEHPDPSTRETAYRFYGYVTRKSDTKILLQSDIDISRAESHVISGNGFAAVLDVLAQYVDTQGQEEQT